MAVRTTSEPGRPAPAPPSAEPERLVTRGDAWLVRGGPVALDRRLVLLATAMRWSLLALGLLIGASRRPDTSEFLAVSSALVAFALFATLRPPHLEPLDRDVVLAVAIELALTVTGTVATGRLESPFLLTIIVPTMLAGYTWGRRQLVGIAAAGALAVGVVTVIERGHPASQRSTIQVAVVFLLCGMLGSFTRRFVTELREHDAVLDQVSRLAAANDLLVALGGLVPTLPASLDLADVVDSTRTRLRGLLEFTTIAVLVHEEVADDWRVLLAEGTRLPGRLGSDTLPAPLRVALTHPEPTVVTDLLAEGAGGCSPVARSGIYVPLRARGGVVGLLALEHTAPGRYDRGDVARLAALVGPAALALDNARWFARLSRFGAESERARIARELHDRLAQSFAYVAFELERLSGSGPAAELAELGTMVRSMVTDLRETIYQLRAAVTEDLDLEEIATGYLSRYEARTGIAVDWSSGVEPRPPYQVEQELWRILQEALSNVERHSGARRVIVRWRVGRGRARLEIRDDGCGFRPDEVAGDHYGLLGMYERADMIGAHLTVDSEPGLGTRVIVELEVPR